MTRPDGRTDFRVTNNRTWVKEVAVTLKVEYRVRVGAYVFDVIRDAGIAAREAVPNVARREFAVGAGLVAGALEVHIVVFVVPRCAVVAPLAARADPTVAAEIPHELGEVRDAQVLPN